MLNDILMPTRAPKKISRSMVITKVSHVTHDSSPIFGSFWKTKLVTRKVLSSDKRVPSGAARSVTFITAEWNLPGQVVIKELNGSVLAYVPPLKEEEVVTVVATAAHVPVDTKADTIPPARNTSPPTDTATPPYFPDFPMETETPAPEAPTTQSTTPQATDTVWHTNGFWLMTL